MQALEASSILVAMASQKKKLEFTFDVEVVNVGTFGGSVVQVNIFIAQFCYL